MLFWLFLLVLVAIAAADPESYADPEPAGGRGYNNGYNNNYKKKPQVVININNKPHKQYKPHY